MILTEMDVVDTINENQLEYHILLIFMNKDYEQQKNNFTRI